VAKMPYVLQREQVASRGMDFCLCAELCLSLRSDSVETIQHFAAGPQY
jgi:hypothetical protein